LPLCCALVPKSLTGSASGRRQQFPQLLLMCPTNRSNTKMKMAELTDLKFELAESMCAENGTPSCEFVIPSLDGMIPGLLGAQVLTPINVLSRHPVNCAERYFSPTLLQHTVAAGLPRKGLISTLTDMVAMKDKSEACNAAPHDYICH